MNESVLRLNLSYVLREPSTSRSVVRLARVARRFERRRTRLLRMFENFTDAEFREHLVVHPTQLQELQWWDVTGSIITATVGLPTLLPHALRLLTNSQYQPSMTVIDVPATSDPIGRGDPPLSDPRPPAGDQGGSTLPDINRFLLFNSPTLLSLDTKQAVQGSVFVGGLIARPGERDLMLTGTILDEPSHNNHAVVTMHLEDVVRDFADQWTPSYALWQQPMEHTHPEILERTPAQGSRS